MKYYMMVLPNGVDIFTKINGRWKCVYSHDNHPMLITDRDIELWLIKCRKDKMLTEEEFKQFMLEIL